MRLTREENPTEIEKYEHIKAAPTFGPLRCFSRLPGGVRTCTLGAGHDGPHVAHGGWLGNKVYAVWSDRPAEAKDANRIDLSNVPDVLAEGVTTRIGAMDGPDFEEFRRACEEQGLPWQWEGAAMTLAAMYQTLATTDQFRGRATDLTMATLQRIIDPAWDEKVKAAARVLVGDRMPMYLEALNRSSPFGTGLSEDPARALLFHLLMAEEVLAFWSPVIEAWDINKDG